MTDRVAGMSWCGKSLDPSTGPSTSSGQAQGERGKMGSGFRWNDGGLEGMIGGVPSPRPSPRMGEGAWLDPSTGPSTSSGQALRQAQDRPFDKLRTGPSTSSGQALRQAQDRPFDKLRTGPSTSSGQALRQAQDRLRVSGGGKEGCCSRGDSFRLASFFSCGGIRRGFS